MNDTASSASGASLLPNSTDLFTGAHLTIIAVLIALTVIAILYGAKLARRRHRAEHEIERHNAEVEAPTPARPTVAPAPPPATDDAAVGTPAANTDAAFATRSPGASGSDGPVTQLKGLGPKVAARLAELGITTVGQLAALDEAAAARLDDDLGTFRGRMARDRWIEQARLLAADDKAGFEAAFGRL